MNRRDFRHGWQGLTGRGLQRWQSQRSKRQIGPSRGFTAGRKKDAHLVDTCIVIGRALCYFFVCTKWNELPMLATPRNC